MSQTNRSASSPATSAATDVTTTGAVRGCEVTGIDPALAAPVAPAADQDEAHADRDHQRREQRDEPGAGQRRDGEELRGGDAQRDQRQSGPEPSEERPLVGEVSAGAAVGICGLVFVFTASRRLLGPPRTPSPCTCSRLARFDHSPASGNSTIIITRPATARKLRTTGRSAKLPAAMMNAAATLRWAVPRASNRRSTPAGMPSR